MRELSFSDAVYADAAVDEAIAAFAQYAQIERLREGINTLVRVTADSPTRERRVAGELANFALGMTIRDMGAR